MAREVVEGNTSVCWQLPVGFFQWLDQPEESLKYIMLTCPTSCTTARGSQFCLIGRNGTNFDLNPCRLHRFRYCFKGVLELYDLLNIRLTSRDHMTCGIPRTSAMFLLSESLSEVWQMIHSFDLIPYILKQPLCVLHIYCNGKLCQNLIFTFYGFLTNRRSSRI